MAHIELHDTLPDHPKLLRLARALGRDPVTTLGHLACLWLWAIRFRPGGDLNGLASPEIAAAARWRRNPETLVVELRAAGLMEGDSLHDWSDYTKNYRRAESERARIATHRRRVRERVTTPLQDVREQYANSTRIVGVRGTEQSGTERSGAEQSGIREAALPPETEIDPPPPFSVFEEAWAGAVRASLARAPGLQPMRKATDARKRAWKTRMGDSHFRDHWRESLALAASRTFCCGAKGWQMDADFFLRPDTVVVLLEGKYADGPPPANPKRAAYEANQRELADLVEKTRAQEAAESEPAAEGPR